MTRDRKHRNTSVHFGEGELSSNSFVDAMRALPVSIAHTDRDLRYTWLYNPTADPAISAALGKQLVEVVATEGSRSVMAVKSKVLETGERVELQFSAHHDDGPHTFRISVDPLKEDDEIVGVSTVVIDLTPTLRAEASLIESEERFSKAFRASPDPLAIADPEGRFVEINAAFVKIFGFARDEVIGRTTKDLGLYLDPKDRDRIRAVFLANGYVRDFEVDLINRDGDVVHGLVSGEIIDIDGQPFNLAIFRDITDKKRADDARKASEDALRESEARLRCMNEELETRVRERTEELVRANRELEERNRELQSFAYVASHDMQEPLRKVQTFADLIRNDFASALPSDGAAYLDRLQHSAARMSQVLSDLLAFSRITAGPQATYAVRVDDVVRDVLEDLQLAVNAADAEIEINADVTIRADEAQLRQLLNHLIMNALKYRRSEGRCRISVDVRPETMPDGEVCRIEVADNGIGFDMRYADKIFEPFQRLHERGSYPGTGMGLAICRRIVHRHRGAISVDSRPGEGSRFTVVLPAGSEGLNRDSRPAYLSDGTTDHEAAQLPDGQDRDGSPLRERSPDAADVERMPEIEIDDADSPAAGT